MIIILLKKAGFNMDNEILAKKIEKIISELRNILDELEDERREELYGIGTASKETEKKGV